MDKAKYNRAAKDPSQLQQFVDEVCDNVGGTELTLEDKEHETSIKLEAYNADIDDPLMTIQNADGNHVDINPYGIAIETDDVEQLIVKRIDTDARLSISPNDIQMSGDSYGSADYSTSGITVTHPKDGNAFSSSIKILADDKHNLLNIYALDDGGGFDARMFFGFDDDIDAFTFSFLNDDNSGIRVIGTALQLIFEGSVTMTFESEERLIKVNNEYFSFPNHGGTFLVNNAEVEYKQVQQEQDINIKLYAGKIVRIDTSHFENTELTVYVPSTYRFLNNGTRKLSNMNNEIIKSVTLYGQTPNVVINFDQNQIGEIIFDMRDSIVLTLMND